MLNYANIEWTTGIASGGNAKTGLGGIPAQVLLDNLTDVILEGPVSEWKLWFYNL